MIQIKILYNLLKSFGCISTTLWIMDTRGLIHSNYQLKTNRGSTINLRPHSSDKNEFYHIMSSLEYDKLANILPYGSVVDILDIGGNIGLFTLRINELYSLSHSTIIEADKDNLISLNTNITNNKLDHKTSIYEFAIYSKDDIEVYFDNTKNHDAKNISSNNTGTKVKTCSLKKIFDNRNNKPFDIAKIDIEGGEYNLLTKENISFFSLVSCIIIEYHDGKDKLLSYFLTYKKLVYHIEFNSKAGLLYLISK